jgi:hypothetical protein
LQKELQKLEEALKAGDINTAQSIIKEIQSHAPKSNNSSSDSSTGNRSTSSDPIGAALSSIESDLAGGDTTGAESTLSALTTQLQQMPLPPRDSDGDSDGSGANSGGSTTATSHSSSSNADSTTGDYTVNGITYNAKGQIISVDASA